MYFQSAIKIIDEIPPIKNTLVDRECPEYEVLVGTPEDLSTFLYGHNNDH